MFVISFSKVGYSGDGENFADEQEEGDESKEEGGVRRAEGQGGGR